MAVEQGRVVEVNIITSGSEATQDHAIGATVLHLEDTADFDDDGGRIWIEGTVGSYKARDDDADTITLVNPLSIDVPDETQVFLYPLSKEKWATVIMEDGDDAVLARIPMFLYQKVEDGVRDEEEQESCLLELEGSEWVIRDIIGLEDDSGSKPWDDTFEITVAGGQELQLTNIPQDHSEHVYVNGVYYHESNGWARTSEQTITVGSDMGLRPGDEVTVEYLYIGKGEPKAIQIIPWDSLGWRVLRDLPNSDSANYSSPSFDDSTWGTAQMKITWDSGKNLKTWARKWFPAAKSVTMHLDIEDHADVYVNGTRVISQAYKGPGIANDDRTIEYEIPESVLNESADNLLAIVAFDDTASNSGMNCDLWGVPIT